MVAKAMLLVAASGADSLHRSLLMDTPTGGDHCGFQLVHSAHFPFAGMSERLAGCSERLVKLSFIVRETCELVNVKGR